MMPMPTQSNVTELPGSTSKLPTFSQRNARPIPVHLFGKIEFQTGPVIPGLEEGAIPQGLAYDCHRKLYLISAYMPYGIPSQLFLVDKQTEKLLHSFSLSDIDGKPHVGHVGGVATDGENVWIASDGVVLHYRPFEHIGSVNRSIIAVKEFIPETQADYLSWYGQTLWVGEFFLEGQYGNKKSSQISES